MHTHTYTKIDIPQTVKHNYRQKGRRKDKQTDIHGHAYTHTYTKIDIPQTVKHSYGQKGRRKDKQTDI